MVVVANAAVSLDGIISKYNLTFLIIKYVIFVTRESLNRAIPLSLRTFLSSILPYREYSPFRIGEIPCREISSEKMKPSPYGQN